MCVFEILFFNAYPVGIRPVRLDSGLVALAI